MHSLSALTGRWREEAETLRAYGAHDLADAAERHAAQVEVALRAHEREELTVQEAALESGYSVKRLRELVREGKIPDHRSPGSKGEIRIRRCDLPRKPAGERERVGPVDELAGRLRDRRS